MRRPYRKLNLDERRILATMLQAKATKTKIAEVLGRDRSTIHREIKRNWWHDEEVPQADGYWHVTAQTLADRRYLKRRKLEQHEDLRDEVIGKLKAGWSPEQIGNRMIFEGDEQRVCQETIYRHIYSKEGMSQELWWYLPMHRKNRVRKRQKSKFDRDVSILFRPDDIAHRREFGHWEGDLMLFEQKRGQTNVTSLFERVSRYGDP